MKSVFEGEFFPTSFDNYMSFLEILRKIINISMIVMNVGVPKYVKHQVLQEGTVYDDFQCAGPGSFETNLMSREARRTSSQNKV